MRTKWPFGGMSVGDIKIFDGWDAMRAQRAAHTYAQKSGKKFRTRWEGAVLVVECVDVDAVRVGKRIDHPIWDLSVGQKVELELYEYTTTAPDVFARSVTRQTGRKFKCRKVKDKLCVWTIERVS